jgi:hypothetical protein
MPDSTVIPHVLGTIALISIFLAMEAYYDGLYTKLSEEAYKAQLNQVAEHIASNLIDLVVVAQVAEEVFLVKKLEIPRLIADKPYNITITEMSKGEDVSLVSILLSRDRANIYAYVELPWTAEAISIYSDQAVDSPYNITLTTRLESIDDLGGALSIVVWCWRSGDSIVIGLGLIEEG